MPPPPRTHCKLDDCNELAHTWPNGKTATYCRDHLKLRHGTKRDGLESMGGQMRRVLQYLLDAKKHDEPFQPLAYPLCHAKTLNILTERDWIFSSKGVDGDLKYKITGRGEKALSDRKAVIVRKDGICPKCGVRPRAVSKSGRSIGFCRECERERSRLKQRRLRGRGNPATLCSRCKSAPRHISATGRFSSYCSSCEQERQRQKEHRRQVRLLEAVRNGESTPLCPTCKARPRRVYPNSIAKLCSECLKDARERRKNRLKSEAFRQKLMGVSR